MGTASQQKTELSLICKVQNESKHATHTHTHKPTHRESIRTIPTGNRGECSPRRPLRLTWLSIKRISNQCVFLHPGDYRGNEKTPDHFPFLYPGGATPLGPWGTFPRHPFLSFRRAAGVQTGGTRPTGACWGPDRWNETNRSLLGSRPEERDQQEPGSKQAHGGGGSLRAMR